MCGGGLKDMRLSLIPSGIWLTNGPCVSFSFNIRTFLFLLRVLFLFYLKNFVLSSFSLSELTKQHFSPS
jgi:hypothetical protein